jgi:hypothetical protein
VPSWLISTSAADSRWWSISQRAIRHWAPASLTAAGGEQQVDAGGGRALGVHDGAAGQVEGAGGAQQGAGRLLFGQPDQHR